MLPFRMDVNFPFVSSISSTTSCDDQRLSIPPSSVPLPSSSEEKSSTSEPWAFSTVVTGDQYIGHSCATRLSVHLKNAPVGSHVIFTPESLLIHRLCLESTLSAVHADYINDGLVTNKTGSSVILKDGVFLGTFDVLHLSSIEEPLHLPAGAVKAQNADVTDLADVMAHLRPHVIVLDYPEAKPALLNLLAQRRQAVTLQKEPLGVTNKVTHHIALQPCTQPSYVPSYRLPHSQKQVV